MKGQGRPLSHLITPSPPPPISTPLPWELIVVGTSLGGLEALSALFAGLPGDFPLPIVVVQHRRAEGGPLLKATLQRYSALRLHEPFDKEDLVPGTIYLAPADYHLLVEREAVALSTEAPVHCARPSIDVLFESAADAYTDRVIGVVLTGAGRDGARGAARIKEQGGALLVLDPDSAECDSMPAAALAEAGADWVLPITEIAPCLVRCCGAAHR